MLYRLNLIYLIIINSNQGLARFRKTQVHRPTRRNKLKKKQKNEDLLYSCLMLDFIS